MSDEQTDNPNLPEVASVTNVSGGVNVDAARDVNIGGDVVGRDKITHVQNINTDGGAYVGGNVVVEPGGKFVGGDEINQFHGPQFAPPVDVTSYVDDFRTEYKRFFVGRQTELSKLNEWLRSNVPFAIVAASAGWGKSALLANWVDQLQQENAINVVYHPISIRYGTNARKEILASLLLQLTKIHRQDNLLKNWDPDYLENRLGELLKETPPIASPVLVVIDGLDEVAESPQRYLRLPNRIAPNIRLLVSMRTSDERHDLNDWMAHLNWAPEDYRRIDIGTLSLSDLEDVPRRLGLSVDPEIRKQLIGELYRLSYKGDALTLSLYLKTIHDDLSDGKFVTTKYIDAMHQQEPGLGPYLKHVIQQIDTTTSTFRPILDVLAIAHGRVTELDWEALGVPLSDELRRLITDTRQLIIGNAGRGFDFSHSRIRATYRQEHMTRARRTEISEKFVNFGNEVLQRLKQGQLATEEVPPYFLRHYSKHLVESDPIPFDQLSDLLSEAWMTAHFLAAGSYDGFLSDVVRIRESAEQHETKDRLVWSLGIQMKSAMCITSVASIAGNLPPSFPAALVLDGTWDSEQEIGYANHVPDQIQRMRTWLALLKASTEKIAPQRGYLVSSILDTLERLDKSHATLCAQMLIDLTPYLQPGGGLLKEAQDLARSLSSSAWRARVLAHMLPVAPTADEQIQLFAEVLRACSEMSSIDDDQKRLRPYALEAIVKHMPAGALAPALALAFPEHEYPDRKGVLLEGLARHMTKAFADEFLQVCVAMEWNDRHYRAAAFIHLAPVLSPDSLLAVAEHIDRLAAQKKYRDYGSPYLYDMPSIGLTVLAQYAQDELTTILIHLMVTSCLQGDIDAHCCRYDETVRRTLQTLCELGLGQVSDEDAAQRFKAHEIDLAQDDFDLFCLLGPLSAAAIATKYSEMTFIQTYFIRKSPYFLSALATRLADRDLGLVLKLGADDVETWGCLRALAVVADRLLPEDRMAAIEYAIASYADDNAAAALVALRKYLSADQVVNLVTQIIRWSTHSASWTTLEAIAKQLPQDVCQEAALSLKKKLSAGYDLEGAESLVLLTASHPDGEWRKEIWQAVISRADLIDDLPARWSVIERLEAHTRDNQHRRLWRSQLLAQTRRAFDSPQVSTIYRDRHLEYLPFTQRMREAHKLLTDFQTENSTSLSPAKMAGVSLLAALMASNKMQRTWSSLMDSNIVRPKALIRKIFARVLRRLAYLRPAKNAEQENVERILHAAQQEVTNITEQNPGEHAELLHRVYRHFEPICGDIKYFRFQSRLLQERGADIWQALPSEYFEQALDVAIEREADLHTRQIGAFKLAVFLPGLATHKSALLAGLQDAIDTYYNGTFQQPLLLTLLAYYASKDDAFSYVAGIDHALQVASNLFDEPQYFVGLVLMHAVQVAPAEALPEIAARLAEYRSSTTTSDSTIAALLILMERPEADLKVFESIWPAARQLLDSMSALPLYHRQLGESSYLNRFVDASVPKLNGKYVGELFLALCGQPETPEIHEAIVRVRDHWLQLCDEISDANEARTAWHLIMNELSQKPRAHFLDKAEWLVSVMAKLGGNQAVISAGDGIIEVSNWKWIAVKAQSGDTPRI